MCISKAVEKIIFISHVSTFICIVMFVLSVSSMVTMATLSNKSSDLFRYSNRQIIPVIFMPCHMIVAGHSGITLVAPVSVCLSHCNIRLVAPVSVCLSHCNIRLVAPVSVCLSMCPSVLHLSVHIFVSG